VTTTFKTKDHTVVGAANIGSHVMASIEIFLPESINTIMLVIGYKLIFKTR